MSTPSFTRIATVTASTKRLPTIVSGKAGAPTTSIASLRCTPLVDPSDAQVLKETYQINTLVYLLETYVQDNLDIITGDTLVIASGNYAGEYPIRIVQKIPFGSIDVRKRLVLEGLKR